MVMQITWAPANEPCTFRGNCIPCKASLQVEVEKDSLSLLCAGAFGNYLPFEQLGEIQKRSLLIRSKAYRCPRGSVTPGVYVPADVKYNLHYGHRDLDCQNSEQANDLQGPRKEEEEDVIILVESAHDTVTPLPHEAMPSQRKKRGKSFGDLSLLQNGEPLGAMAAANPFQCPYCSKQFFRSANLRMHKLTHSSERPHKCPVCQKGFIRTADVWRHLHSFHKIERSSVVLEKANLKNHWSILQQGSSDRQTSEEPGRMSGEPGRTSGESSPAVSENGGENPKRYACPVCSKRFGKPNLVSRHKKIHWREKPHKCSECGLAFAQQSWLKRHQEKHTGARPFCCKKCGRTFTRLGSLTRHQRTHA